MMCARVCLHAPDSVRRSGAAHPCFKYAPKVPDPLLSMNLGLGGKHTHSKTQITHKTCCINILFWFHVTSRNTLIPVAKKHADKRRDERASHIQAGHPGHPTVRHITTRSSNIYQLSTILLIVGDSSAKFEKVRLKTSKNVFKTSFSSRFESLLCTNAKQHFTFDTAVLKSAPPLCKTRKLSVRDGRLGQTHKHSKESITATAAEMRLYRLSLQSVWRQMISGSR